MINCLQLLFGHPFTMIHEQGGSHIPSAQRVEKKTAYVRCCVIFVNSPGVFPSAAYTKQPVESSPDETPMLCQPVTKGSLITYVATTPLLMLTFNHA